jgi:hypothetical protein
MDVSHVVPPGKPDPRLQHHLISLDLRPAPYCFHAYLMTTNHERDISRVANKMLGVIQEQFGPGIPMVPIVLASHLTKSADEVRQGIGERHAEAAKAMKEATTFHLTMWFMPHEDPWNDWLMALH